MDNRENQHITPIYSKPTTNPRFVKSGEKTEPEKEEVKYGDTPSAEEYITKLRHSKKGIRWWDTKNSNLNLHQYHMTRTH